jgi:hypothetical protein
MAGARLSLEVAMNMPERNVALTWVGRTVVDRDGAEIGACTAVFADDATELAEWVCSEFEGGVVFIPAVGAGESDGMVQVVISREDVAGAPAVGGPEHISGDEEAALYRHYGIPHSRDASPTVLPTDDAVLPGDDAVLSGDEPATTADTATTDWTDSADSVNSADWTATPDASAAPAAQRDTAPEAAADREEAVSRPSSAKSKVALAAGGSTALAAAAGAVLRARRRRKQPATRVQRFARPVVETTTRVARKRGTGVAMVTSALAAAVLAARRRRASRDDLNGSQDVLYTSLDVPTSSRNDVDASGDVRND